MANKGQENLIPMSERSKDEVRELGQKGGIRSGEVRREIATMKKTLEKLLNSTNNKGKEYKDLVTLGLIANAIDKTKGGNPEAYKTIAKILGEYETNEEDRQQNELSKLDILLNSIQSEAKDEDIN